LNKIKVNFVMISRWNISSLVDLPEYMKLCYKSLLDIFEETEQELRNQEKENFVKYAEKEVWLIFWFLIATFKILFFQ